MERKRLVIDSALVAAILLLAGLAWAQHSTLSTMEETVARLEARVEAVESGRPVMVAESDESDDEDAPSHPGDVETVRLVPRLGPVASAAAPSRDSRVATAPTIDVADPEVRGQLREVIAEEQEAIQQERWQQRSQRREERLRKQVGDLAEQTEMDPLVSEQLTDILVVEQAEASEIFRQSREDFSWDEARDKVGKLRTETDAKAKELLDEDEYAEYQKMREEEAARFGGGPRGQTRDRGPSNPTQVRP